jgi:hypothetical protein
LIDEKLSAVRRISAVRRMWLAVHEGAGGEEGEAKRGPAVTDTPYGAITRVTDRMFCRHSHSRVDEVTCDGRGEPITPEARETVLAPDIDSSLGGTSLIHSMPTWHVLNLKADLSTLGMRGTGLRMWESANACQRSRPHSPLILP